MFGQADRTRKEVRYDAKKDLKYCNAEVTYRELASYPSRCRSVQELLYLVAHEARDKLV